jgi:hypothetical protein
MGSGSRCVGRGPEALAVTAPPCGKYTMPVEGSYNAGDRWDGCPPRLGCVPSTEEEVLLLVLATLLAGPELLRAKVEE